ncbi:glycosyltransferase [Stutzerimonas xanthomarina]|nr:glycosyltransferase [Stutzerimonas xanthomarina]
MSEIKNYKNADLGTSFRLPVGLGRQGEGGARISRGKLKTSVDERPLISVVTVVFNGGDFIEKTILSVLGQKYSNVEYIIIDGGSTDGTLDILRRYEGLIEYWVSERDSGIYDAMNKGAEIASGDWICFMNGGDLFFDDRVIHKIAESITPTSQVCFGKSLSTYEDMQVVRYEDFGSSERDFYLTKMPNHQAIFIRKDKYKSVRYSLDYRYCSDTDYLRRVFDEAAYCEYPGFVSRFELGGVSNYYGKFSVYRAMVKEYRMLGYGYFYSFFAHSIKYFFQLSMGRKRYLRFYAARIVRR